MKFEDFWKTSCFPYLRHFHNRRVDNKNNAKFTAKKNQLKIDL